MRLLVYLIIYFVVFLACDSTSGPGNTEPFPNRLISIVGMPPDPTGIAVSPDGESICVIGYGSWSYMLVVDSGDFSVLDTLYTDSHSNAIEFNHSGTSIFLLPYNKNQVSIVDATTYEIVDSITVGSPAIDIMISPNDEYLYTVHGSSVSAIRTSDHFVEAEIDVGPTIGRACITPDGSHLYVGLSLSNSVAVVSTESYSVVDSIYVGKSLYDLECEPGGQYVLVVCEDGHLVLIRTSDNEIAKIFGGWWYGTGIGYLPDGSYAYISGSDSLPMEHVTVFDTVDYEIAGSVYVGYYPNAIAVHPSGDYLYVIQFDLSVIGH